MNERQSIIIIGNSGFARECHIMLAKVLQERPKLSFGGFLSFEGYQGDLKELAPLQLGTDDEYRFSDNERVIIALGEPALRRKAHLKLKAKGVAFFNLIHPQSYIAPSTTLGEANIIGCNCHFSCNCAIGDCNVFNGLVHVGHDCTIGDYNFVAPNVQILGGVAMGSGNSIGATSVILPRAKMGDGNIVSPLSAVYKGCKNNARMHGNPATKIGAARD